MSGRLESKKKNDLLFPFVLVFLEVITFLSTDMYLPALPSMAEYFKVDQETAQYTQTLWFLGSMSLQLFLGPVCELYGRKLILNIGVVIFIITSFICGITDDITTLLIARFFQGTTVCIVLVAGYALIHELYSGKRAVQILAIMGSITILAPAFGPLLGAVIISFSHWQNIFLLLSACGVIGLVGASFAVPVKNNPAKKKINLAQELASYHAIVTDKHFMSIALIGGLMSINFFIWIVESPFIMIGKNNISELYFGLAQMVVFAGFIVGSQLARKLVVKFSPRTMCAIGFTISGCALTCFVLFSLLHSIMLFNVLAMSCFAIGSSSMSGVLNRLAMSSSSAPMSHKVAIYTLIVSLSATLGSYMVTMINDQSFINIGWLMITCYALGLMMYLSVRNSIKDSL